MPTKLKVNDIEIDSTKALTPEQIGEMAQEIALDVVASNRDNLVMSAVYMLDPSQRPQHQRRKRR